MRSVTDEQRVTRFECSMHVLVEVQTPQLFAATVYVIVRRFCDRSSVCTYKERLYDAECPSAAVACLGLVTPLQI